MPSQLSLFGAPAPAEPPARQIPEIGLDPSAASHAPLPPGVRLGTSSWSFPGWRGHLWDRAATEEELARGGLAAYVRHPLLGTVGVDRSHYKPMTAEEFAALAAQTPPDFRFLVKGHEDCTLQQFPAHPRYGRRAGQPNPRFLDPAWAAEAALDPWLTLGPRAGILLFQFAPQPGLEDRSFTARLDAFLSALVAHLPATERPHIAVELRNAPLYSADIADVLDRHGVLPCLTVWGRLPPLAVQARRLRADRHPTRLIRWMLPPGVTYEEQRAALAPFDRLAEPDPAIRAEIVTQIREARADGAEATVIVNNKAEGCSVLSIVEIARALQGR